MDNPDVVLFGLMSSMRTGNMIFDMAVCLMLPVLFSQLWEYVQDFYRRGRHHLGKKLRREYSRQISYTEAVHDYEDRHMSFDENRVLVQAIRSYIGREVKPTYRNGDYKLQAIQTRKDTLKSGSKVEQLLKRFKIVCTPPKRELVELEPGLYVRDDVNIAEDDGEEGAIPRGRGRGRGQVKVTEHNLVLSAPRQGGKARVDAFVDRSYAWYKQQLRGQKDTTRFMYQPLVKGATSEAQSKSHRYKRYELSSDKTFDAMFFPERSRVLRLLDHFTNRTGKFAIPGFPYKLGMLLHGPPGTGKTSLVKALAAETKRHIITVPLSRIRTNQELMDVMFDQVFPHQVPGKKDTYGEPSGPTKDRLRINEVVFLLEDVDAASDVVKARGQGDGAIAETGMTRAISALYAKPDDHRSGAATPRDQMTEAGHEKWKKGDKGDKEGKKKKKWWEDKDKLDLAGLLNVLDGVIDAPGRILVMTTNHPEKLDPALLRPGRVNMKLYMGHMRVEDALKMAELYFPDAAPAEIESVRAMWDRKTADIKGGLKVSPAEFEQLCAENATTAALCSALDTIALRPAA